MAARGANKANQGGTRILQLPENLEKTLENHCLTEVASLCLK